MSTLTTDTASDFEELSFARDNWKCRCVLKMLRDGRSEIYVDGKQVLFGTVGDKYKSTLTGPQLYKTMYTNYRGQSEERILLPRAVWWGTTPYHPESQWFLRAKDDVRKVKRDFALKDFSAFDHVRY
jgi:hypothetical protein